jgi:hypothetical protein
LFARSLLVFLPHFQLLKLRQLLIHNLDALLVLESVEALLLQHYHRPKAEMVAS